MVPRMRNHRLDAGWDAPTLESWAGQTSTTAPDVIYSQGGWSTDIDPCQPCGDSAVHIRRDDVQPHSAIDPRPMALDETGVAEETQLSCDGRPAEIEFDGKTRRSPR